jgi:dTDP-4-amino-4,6-dideoxygalactose transaminase
MLTGPPSLLESARIWALHGMSRDAYRRYSAEGSWRYDVLLPGFKYNMADLQAAIGLVQLRRLPELQERRAEIVASYDRAFCRLPEVQVPAVRPQVESARHLYVLRLHLDRLTIDRAGFIRELGARLIGSSVHFIPIHHHTYYRERYRYPEGAFPVADREFERIVSLPLSPRLDDDDVDDVIRAVSEIVERFRRRD